MTKPEKMHLASMDIAQEKREQLKELFPEAFNENKVDFDQLKRALGEWAEPSKERFGLNWPGKAECMKIIQQPSVATLKPDRDESLNFDDTENLFIEGDNLEVLKLLQKSYFGKVKMIYIDPPYNTGREFIYPDKYSETLETYLAYTGQIDDDGRKFSTNTDTGGRYHSRWLNMMYPRLYLAKNLLREDGVIFISIDDNEQGNLKALCDQILGEETHLGTFIWETKRAARGVPPGNMLMHNHEYVLVYSKEKFAFKGEDRKEEDFANPDNDPRGQWRSESMRATGAQDNYFSIVNPENAMEFHGNWAFSEQKVKKMISEGLILFPENKDGTPRQKKFIDSYINQTKAIVTHLGWFSTEKATKQLMDLFDGEKLFEHPKPLDLIRFLVNQSTQPGDIILDFFAGSCTSAHAVIQQNATDDGNRRYIMVQLPEPTANDTKAFKYGYQSIAAVGMERIRRAAKKIEEECSDQLGLSEVNNLDLSFKVFRLTSSNFKVWESNHSKISDLEQQLLDHVVHIDSASTSEDILYELMLKAGLQLTTKVEKVIMSNKEVFSIEDGAMLICLDKKLDQAVIDAMAEASPRQVICLDEGFKNNDQLKANAVQTFKSLSPDESEIVFRTV